MALAITKIPKLAALDKYSCLWRWVTEPALRDGMVNHIIVPMVQAQHLSVRGQAYGSEQCGPILISGSCLRRMVLNMSSV